jgi:hypothetical protein
VAGSLRNILTAMIVDPDGPRTTGFIVEADGLSSRTTLRAVFWDGLVRPSVPYRFWLDEVLVSHDVDVKPLRNIGLKSPKLVGI